MPPETCASADAASRLEVSQLLLRGRTPRGRRLVARAIFPVPPDFDPSRTGAIVELRMAGGALGYRAEVPASALVRRAGRTYLFTPGPWSGPPGAPGLRRLKLRQRRTLVTMQASVRGDAFTPAVAEPALGLTLRLGAACSESPPLECTTDTSGVTRCS